MLLICDCFHADGKGDGFDCPEKTITVLHKMCGCVYATECEEKEEIQVELVSSTLPLGRYSCAHCVPAVLVNSEA